MKKQLVTGVLLIVAQSFLTAPGTAFGQWYVGGGWGSAQTPLSAGATGVGNLVRSEGAYNELTSEAMVNVEKARNLYLENQQKATSARLSLRRMAQSENARKREANQQAHARALEFQAAHRPQALTSSQLDPATGEINWPVALMAKEFDDLRQSLQDVFEARAKYGLTSESASKIIRLTGEVKDTLRGHIATIPLHDYSEARRFLDSMMVAASE